jgi:sacsin
MAFDLHLGHVIDVDVLFLFFVYFRPIVSAVCRFNKSSLPGSFRDQFRPFHHFGCDFQDAYKGTLFRFPLRNAALARRSEISKRSYSPADAKANLTQFASQLSQHLLFLRSVRTIEIYHR